MLDQSRARMAWLKGAKAVRHRPADAATQFERAVTFDPGMADAWLGLHAMGRQRDIAITSMAHNADRFGEERRRNTIPLTSRFGIGPYATWQLQSHHDLWCAVTAYHLDRDEHDIAASALRLTFPQAVEAGYLRGRFAFLIDDLDTAITELRAVFGRDRFLEASARLMSGILLAGAGAMHPAKDHLRWVLNQQFLPQAHAEALYRLGLIARAEGDEDRAMRHFQFAYAQRPNFPGLKEAMERPVPKARARPAPAGGVARNQQANENSERQEESPETVEEDPPETVDQVLADLDQQVGQEDIKRQVRILLAQTRAESHRRAAGLPAGRMTEHFVFTGPPGTGKTTIARTIARLYKALGILEGGHVIEVDRSGLIGQHLGSTVAKTQGALDKAMGGVLFIDEAYALQVGGIEGGDAYGREAIDTLLKRMEDDRDQFVVIAAGYPEPMQQFLESNPGLSSRFTTTIDFPAYTADELVRIADVTATNTGNSLTDEARTAIREILAIKDAEGELTSPTFGNARFIRNLIEKAARQRDLRLFSNTDGAPPEVSAMTELTAADIQASET